MSIAIVSSLPSTAHTANASANDAADASTEGGLNFAAMFLGQISAAPQGTEIGQLIDNEGRTTASTEEDSTTGTADVMGDLLAALGLTQQQTLPQTLADMANDNSRQSSTSNTIAEISLDSSNVKQTDLSSEDTDTATAALTTNLVSEDTATAVDSESDGAAKFADMLENAADTRQTSNADTLAGTQNVHAQRPHSTQHTTATQTTHAVETPVKDKAWTEDFNQKVVWMAKNDTQSAQITLNPPNMGPVEISLSVDSTTNSASATFVSANADVREAIETALPKLKEMMQGAGIQLGQANVSSESFRQQQQQNTSAQSSETKGDNAILSVSQNSATTATRIISSGNGLVDLFA